MTEPAAPEPLPRTLGDLSAYLARAEQVGVLPYSNAVNQLVNDPPWNDVLRGLVAAGAFPNGLNSSGVVRQVLVAFLIEHRGLSEDEALAVDGARLAAAWAEAEDDRARAPMLSDAHEYLALLRTAWDRWHQETARDGRTSGGSGAGKAARQQREAEADRRFETAFAPLSQDPAFPRYAAWCGRQEPAVLERCPTTLDDILQRALQLAPKRPWNAITLSEAMDAIEQDEARQAREAPAPSCPKCGGARWYAETHARNGDRPPWLAIVCRGCQTPRPGTLGWAFVPLTTDPDAGSRLATTTDGKALAKFRILMTLCFDIPEGEWGRPFGEGRFGKAWKCVLAGLIERGYAADCDSAYALPLATVNAFLAEEAAAIRRDPCRLPFEDPPSPLPAAAPQPIEGDVPSDGEEKDQTPRRRTTPEEREKRVRLALAESPLAASRKVASMTGLFVSQVVGTQTWKAHMAAKSTAQKGRSAKEYQLTDNMLKVIPAPTTADDNDNFDEGNIEAAFLDTLTPDGKARYFRLNKVEKHQKLYDWETTRRTRISPN